MDHLTQGGPAHIDFVFLDQAGRGTRHFDILIFSELFNRGTCCVIQGAVIECMTFWRC